MDAILVKRALACGAIAALLVAAGCQILAGIEDRSHGEALGSAADAADAANDAPAETGPDAPCDPLVPPARPPAASGVAIPDLVFAFRSIVLDQPDAGYDLDQACTCNDAPDDPGSCTSSTPRCDAPRGVDNALAHVVSSTFGGSFASLNFQNRMADGTLDVLFQIQGFNGQEDDDAVSFALFASSGTIPPDAGDSDAMPRPTFDGTDTWTVNPDSFNDVADGGDAAIAKFSSQEAYVRSDALVARSPNAYIGLGDLVLHITDATLTGDLVLASHPYKIANGRITGRVSAESFLLGLPGIKLGPAVSLCPGGSLFEQAKKAICAARDIVSDPARDNRGDACDALSVGMAFTAVEARLGPPRAWPGSVTPCDPDAAAYQCP
jgi:hypothetical protein